MASNQISNQRHTSISGQPSPAGERAADRQTRPHGQQPPGSRSSADDYEEHENDRNSGSLETMRDQAAECWTRGEDQMRELVRDREGTVVMIALAAGLGVGLLVGAARAAKPRPRTWRERMMAEGFGRRLMDRIESLIPETFAEHFPK